MRQPIPATTPPPHSRPRVARRLSTRFAAAAALSVTALAVFAADPVPSATDTRRATWLYDGLLVVSLVANLVSVFVWIRRGMAPTQPPSGSTDAGDRPRTLYATKMEMDLTTGAICDRVTKVESELEDFRAAWKESQQEMSDQAEDRIVRVHERLEKVEEKIAQLPHQIVTLLVNTQTLNLGKGGH